VAVAAVSAGVAVANIAASDSPNVIHACVNKVLKTVRIVNAPADCRSWETPLSWNQTGEPGPQGIQGLQGPVGPEGPEGSPGPQGLAGNLALAGQSCPEGAFVTGFDAGGNIICSSTPPVTPTATPTPAPTGTPVPHVPCDGGFTLDSTDPLEAAKALGICEGVQSAEWVLPDGSAAPAGPSYNVGHGLLADFGTNVLPQEGSALLGLSSGTARDANDPGFGGVVAYNKGYTHALPAGFPVTTPSCPTPSTTGYDGVALKVTVQVPAGVTGLSFDWKYYTFEYPEWVCTSYVDQAAVLLDGGNVLLTGSGDPVNSNTPMEVCSGCVLGTADLMGTGFDALNDSGATDWHAVTMSATAGGTYELVFTIWDSSDSAFDSTILFDNWQWLP
jgi:hypothetical protein